MMARTESPLPATFTVTSVLPPSIRSAPLVSLSRAPKPSCLALTFAANAAALPLASKLRSAAKVPPPTVAVRGLTVN